MEMPISCNAAAHRRTRRSSSGGWAVICPCRRSARADTLADCAAAPSLFYADLLSPLRAHKNLAAYFDRLLKRPSFARALQEGRATLMDGFPYAKDYIASYERSRTL